MGLFDFIRKKVHNESPLPANPIHDALFVARTQKFASDPVVPGCMMMVGDSITHGAESCPDLFPDVYNQGIAGDTTVDVRKRLPLIVNHKPSKIFLLIGTNNLGAWIATDTTTRQDYPTVTNKLMTDYLEILNYLKNNLPDTIVYVQSILPINPTMPGSCTTGRNNLVITQLNQVLSFVPKLHPNFQFINLYPYFLSNDGTILNSTLTDDGLHPNKAGYEVWSNVLKPYL